jgi:hypothetical protein
LENDEDNAWSVVASGGMVSPSVTSVSEYMAETAQTGRPCLSASGANTASLEHRLFLQNNDNTAASVLPLLQSKTYFPRSRAGVEEIETFSTGKAIPRKVPRTP